MKRKKIFIGCFGTSIVLHAAALFCLQRYSLWFSSSQPVAKSENWLSLVDKEERDQILKTAFDQIEVGETQIQLIPKQEESLALTVQNAVQVKEYDIHVPFELPFPVHEPLLSSPVLPTFLMPNQPFNLLDHLPKDLIVPAPAKAPPPVFLPLPTNAPIALSAKPPNFDQSLAAPIFYSNNLDLALTDEPQVGKAPTPIPLPNLPKLPTLAELETSSYSESFDADLVFLPKEEGTGYFFALTLIPRPDLNLPKLTQHVTFLIDRSNSIQQGRLNATKSAVQKALSEISAEDTFNIIAFDHKMEKMSPNDLYCTTKSRGLAEEFLRKVQLGSFFSTSDLHKPLFVTVPGQTKQDEIYTAILLTDGENLAKKTTQRSILHDWTGYNGGKLSLFAIGMNDLNLPLLDTAAFLNRGKLIHAPTNRGLKRKLLKLLKTIQYPVAKNISCHAISRSPQSKIVLFPHNSQMSHLYLDQPFVILGETDTLDDFILFVQGHLKNRWLNIKKTISFLNARKGSKSLRAEMALQKAYQLYAQFFIDENPKHIAEAALLLEPHDLKAALQ